MYQKCVNKSGYVSWKITAYFPTGATVCIICLKCMLYLALFECWHGHLALTPTVLLLFIPLSFLRTDTAVSWLLSSAPPDLPHHEALYLIFQLLTLTAPLKSRSYMILVNFHTYFTRPTMFSLSLFLPGSVIQETEAYSNSDLCHLLYVIF